MLRYDYQSKRWQDTRTCNDLAMVAERDSHELAEQVGVGAGSVGGDYGTGRV